MVYAARNWRMKITTKPALETAKASKKRILLLVAGCLALIIISCASSYLFLSRGNEAAITSLDSSKVELGSHLKQLNTSWSKADATSVQRQASLKQFIEQTQEQNKQLCSQSSAFYYSLLPARGACKHAADTLDALTTSGRELEVYIADEAKLTEIISKTIAVDATLQQQSDHWSALTSTLETLNVTTALTPVKKSLVEKAKAYGAVWQKLSEADQAKNKTDFLEAQSLLETAHTELLEMAKTTQSSFDEQVASLNSRIDDYLNLTFVK